LLHYGADLYAKDSSVGNTVLHLLVLYGKQDMYAFVMKLVCPFIFISERKEKKEKIFTTWLATFL
jgi:hypothetical protein